MFSANRLAVDIDGSPSAYGVRDQGIEDVCNGLSALKPNECKGKAAAGACYQPCRSAFKAWHDAGHEPSKMKNYMASTGLGGSGGSPPVLVLQDGDRSDWFVSETSTKLKTGDLPAKWSDIAKQAAQVDPLAVPYFVIPGNFRKIAWDATPGDFGVIVAPQTKRSVRFLVGDTGGDLDEVSALLAAKLAGLDEAPTKEKKSALGEDVQRLKAPEFGTSDFRVAIFRHSGKYKGSLGSHKVLDQPSGDLVNWIDTEAGALLDKFGGVDKVLECTTAM
ncbi:hypothetical protein CO662_36690 [Rhizobium anhuiense]|uniref:Uncharacterized protein n=1 Tax=Rhizobium anhuiense TaxID=1184720 RepID=A0ABX4IYH1_9HYPH|nr:hypothetical protein CO668_18790 [Rhizobium anhuiense]PDS45776.1 hypothetical protein CO662_36690 [Rhizobium anhuiense]